jgi:hypothetical protein
MSDYANYVRELNQSRDFNCRLKEVVRGLLDSGELNCASLSDEGGCKVIICKANAEAALGFRFPYFTNIPGRCESYLRVSKPLGVSNGAYDAAGYGQGDLIHHFDSTPGAPYGGFKDAIDQLIKVAAFLDGDLLAYSDEQPEDEQPEDGQLVDEQLVDEQPVDEQPVVEQSDVEQPADEQPVV